MVRPIGFKVRSLMAGVAKRDPVIDYEDQFWGFYPWCEVVRFETNTHGSTVATLEAVAFFDGSRPAPMRRMVRLRLIHADIIPEGIADGKTDVEVRGASTVRARILARFR
jgi:hypothetical protein